MELDFSHEWHIVDRHGPAALAAAELAVVLGRITGREFPRGDGSESTDIIVLHHNGADRSETDRGATRSWSFSWRAAPDRVEIYGDDACGLLRGVYDFLGALGARWIGPGASGERLPYGEHPVLAATAGRSLPDAPALTMILGHGAYLERFGDYFLWAARNGYSSVFIHTTTDALALGAAPALLYESLRREIAPMAQRLGLALELGGHGLSALLPRNLFKKEPGLFRMKEGRRNPDANFCASSDRALAVVCDAFAGFASSHPEIEVFHFWPDDLPEGGWCSCPVCTALSPVAQSLKIASALARTLAALQSGPASPRRLSFLAYHDTGQLTEERLENLPSNLELLWAPRRRCWAHGLDEPSCELNAASAAAFHRAARAWRSAGGGSVTVFEYWEDAVLFKGAVPPLAATMAGDLAVYSGPDHPPEERADRLGLLNTGGRLPLAARPNPWLLSRLAAAARTTGAGGAADRLMDDWVQATYGLAAEPMLGYWEALEAAWKIDLDLEPGDTELFSPEPHSAAVDEPPADWGDPWTASTARLDDRRGRCEELFDYLRAAEAALAEARNMTASAEAVEAEAAEYGISGSLLELDCARLAVYHELGADQLRAAADIALLAQAARSGLVKSLRVIPDARSRRELGFLLFIFYGLRFRAIRRMATRNPLRRLLGRTATLAELALRAGTLLHAWEPRAGGKHARG